MRSLILFAVAALSCVTIRATEVMVLGTYHMANPGHDMHNFKADDVLTDKRQRELAAIADALAKFKPTLVAVEADSDDATFKLPKYHDYLADKLPESRNEVVQVGFRLAKCMQLTDVLGIDADGDFPYEPVKKFADNGHPELAQRLDELGADVDRMNNELGAVLNKGTIAAGLRYLNAPRHIVDSNNFYATMFAYGAGSEQPGAALVTAWEGRNNSICAKLVQSAKPSDRVFVIFGYGHAYLLRRCVQELPGYKLIEPNDYLPK
jgi:hypothetical protein